MSSLMFQEIREFRSFAYRTSGRYQLPNHAHKGTAGSFTAMLSTQSDKTLDALGVLDSLIREMPLKPERVEAVKQRLGDLRTDLVWVIEHPSLFDGNTAESRLFFEKLGTWDDEHRYLSDREAHDLAGSVEDAFTRARRAAERVGLDFYDEPGREEAEVAVKLVTKARSTTGEEARLLMDKVAEILARLLPFDVPEAISAATGSGQAPPQAP